MREGRKKTVIQNGDILSVVYEVERGMKKKMRKRGKFRKIFYFSHPFSLSILQGELVFFKMEII